MSSFQRPAASSEASRSAGQVPVEGGLASLVVAAAEPSLGDGGRGGEQHDSQTAPEHPLVPRPVLLRGDHSRDDRCPRTDALVVRPHGTHVLRLGEHVPWIVLRRRPRSVEPVDIEQAERPALRGEAVTEMIEHRRLPDTVGAVEEDPGAVSIHDNTVGERESRVARSSLDAERVRRLNRRHITIATEDPVPSAIQKLMIDNLHRVFGERDPEKRRAAIAEIVADDVVFSDPEGVVVGAEAVDAKIDELLAGAPGFVFSETGPVRESQDLGLLAWGFGPEGEPPVVTGIDVATVVDGRIATLHTILTND